MRNNLLAEIDNLLLKLNEEQLRAINRKIIERLKLIHRVQSAANMVKFNLMDRVYFIHNNGRRIIGAISRLNQKSISVDCDNGQQWRIAPHLLTKIIEYVQPIKNKNHR